MTPPNHFFIDHMATSGRDPIEQAVRAAELRGHYNAAHAIRSMRKERDGLKDRNRELRKRVAELEAKPKVPADVVSAAASIGAIYSTLKAEGMPENRAFEMTVKLLAQGAVK
ncbi:hypothetical protein [Streptomyces paradoxus]|uniref:hypothetical protein n=1 Tax=Streptomyces paradoxus TaxID=66375 RepID=UPI0037D06E60